MCSRPCGAAPRLALRLAPRLAARLPRHRRRRRRRHRRHRRLCRRSRHHCPRRCRRLRRLGCRDHRCLLRRRLRRLLRLRLRDSRQRCRRVVWAWRRREESEVDPAAIVEEVRAGSHVEASVGLLPRRVEEPEAIRVLLRPLPRPVTHPVPHPWSRWSRIRPSPAEQQPLQPLARPRAYARLRSLPFFRSVRSEGGDVEVAQQQHAHSCGQEGGSAQLDCSEEVKLESLALSRLLLGLLTLAAPAAEARHVQVEEGQVAVQRDHASALAVELLQPRRAEGLVDARGVPDAARGRSQLARHPLLRHAWPARRAAEGGDAAVATMRGAVGAHAAEREVRVPTLLQRQRPLWRSQLLELDLLQAHDVRIHSAQQRPQPTVALLPPDAMAVGRPESVARVG